LKESGDTSNEQPPDCVTVTSCPPIVAVPVRDGPLVAAAVNVIVAGPDPVGGATVIQSALLAAVQGQPPVDVTVTFRVPPLAGTEDDSGVTA
jgi:hypothetical protein